MNNNQNKNAQRLPTGPCHSNNQFVQTQCMGISMTNINILNFKENIIDYLENAINSNDVISVNTDIGNAVILSESEYRGLIETLYLSSVPNMKKKLIKELHTGLEECVEFQW